MFQKGVSLLEELLDFVFPRRTNFEIVQNLKEEDIFALPKADEVPDLDWIHPLFHYRNRKVKAIIWELKYHENILPLETIGKMLFEEIISEMSDILLFDSDAKFLLVPIPITNERRAERGYNQSELIAKSILENDTHRTLLYAPQWLSKIRETERQSHTHSKEERMANLQGSFDASPHVSSHHIFLIDDVATTGSTLLEARTTLLSAGAKDVLAFTIAH